MNDSNIKTILSNRYERLKRTMARRDKIAVFGCGKLGIDIYPVLKKYGLFDAFLDNDVKKQEAGYNGEQVWRVSDYVCFQNNPFIVIATSKENYEVISKQLDSLGLQRNTNYVYIDEFYKLIFPLLSYYEYNKVFVNLAQICVTERCTLRCEKCAHACNLVPRDDEDLSIETVKKSADYFFSNVDVVKEFVIIGGEPLLYKNLAEAIEYIGSKFREKMLMFDITTNGTITPDDTILALCKKYDVTIRLSDYSATLPVLKKQYKKITDSLNGINLLVLDTAKEPWFDYGFGEVDNGDDEKLLRTIFNKCGTPCREVRNEKYYYCVMARSVSENMGINIGLDEYLDLGNLKYKEEIVAFEMGDVKKGFLSMCRYCRGGDARNYPIPAAIQQKVEA